MKVAPFRALTLDLHVLLKEGIIFVEMKVAPFRALTQLCRIGESLSGLSRRNEGRPFQGIDTPCCKFFSKNRAFVEMKVAPFRALTQSFP